MDILGYLKNTHKNPKFGRVRQVPILEPSWEFLGWDLSHFAKFGIFGGYSLNTPKYPKMGIHYFFLCPGPSRRYTMHLVGRTWASQEFQQNREKPIAADQE